MCAFAFPGASLLRSSNHFGRTHCTHPGRIRYTRHTHRTHCLGSRLAVLRSLLTLLFALTLRFALVFAHLFARIRLMVLFPLALELFRAD